MFNVGVSMIELADDRDGKLPLWSARVSSAHIILTGTV